MPRSVEISCRRLLALLCLGCVSAAAFAADAMRLPESSPAERALPIELDATWSELDRRNNRLVFRNLHITQGSLAISADEATADPADFENSTWVFTGNHRLAILTTGLFFVLGLFLLRPVDMARGMRAAALAAK